MESFLVGAKCEDRVLMHSPEFAQGLVQVLSAAQHKSSAPTAPFERLHVHYVMSRA